jgi:hypothetical protein
MSQRGQGGLIAVLAIALILLFFMMISNPCFWGPASCAAANGSNHNPQSAYVPQPGDCVVLPQGQDAVYDLYYAEKVNPANCKAFMDQAQAQAIIDNEINDDNQIQTGITIGMVIGVFLVVGALYVVGRMIGLIQ